MIERMLEGIEVHLDTDYQRYKTWADAEENVLFCGRLAEYRYFDMDTVVARTLSLCDEEFGT